MKKLLISLFSVMLGLAISSVSADTATPDWSKLKDKKQTKLQLYLTPAEAYQHMQTKGDKSLFLDVRSRPEVNFLGMPTVIDANVPYMELSEWYAWNEKKNNFKMEVNSDFANDVEASMNKKGLTKNDTIILICRSGSRSSKAADLLTSLGYTSVYSVPEGFEGDKAKSGPNKGQRVVNGWKNSNLPWSYSLSLNKMYKVGE